jgi:hypothetical protein
MLPDLFQAHWEACFIKEFHQKISTFEARPHHCFCCSAR